MKKYWRLYWSFFRASVMSDIEYRLNIVTKILTDVLWYGAQATIFEVLFHHTKLISGWNLPAARVFMAVLFLVDAVWMILFHENFEKLSWKVRRGELDLLLVKPINSQFMVTVYKQNTSYVINVALTAAYLIFTLAQLPQAVPWWKVLGFLVIGIPTAQAITYSFRLAFSVLSVIFTNAESVNYVWYQIYRLGMRPDAFYPPWLRWTVLSVLPMGFIASVPSRLLMENLDWRLILAGPAIALTLLKLSSWFWVKALRQYASASS